MASVTKRPGYGYQVRWKVGDKYRSKAFDKKKDADNFARQVENELAEGTHVEKKDARTVKEIAELFIRYQEDRLKDGRIGRARFIALKSACDLYIIPHFGPRPIAEIKAHEIVDFYSSMMRGGRLSPFTAKLRVKDFGTLYDFGRRRGAVKVSIYQDAMTELRGIMHTPIRTFTLEEMRRLLDTAANPRKGGQRRPNLMTRIWVCLAAYCGLRLGEINGLTLPCVDFDKSMIRVQHSLTNFDELKSPKTESGKRDVPVPGFILDLLREWIAQYYIENPRKLVFRGREGNHISRTAFYTGNWHCLLKRAGLFQAKDRHRFHACRHFAASWMIENGLSLPDVAGILGHRKFDLTLQTYAHPVMAANHRSVAIERMAARLTVPLLPPPAKCAPVAQDPASD
ncbi:hypothetical protein DK419_13140 [Methylobacterium terrae]|uniref:Tyr recombinase domain-containing protein n=1 Tax=Methylobacterium terrae TaxID=2202827 RepID=A0A2U8WNN9_9HYPH|nr:site-specific integrase [Methylobacterium terrae]AWN47141.1 hypothetical protein DK419_13140 [Methylobacterium terrae]